MSFIQTCCACTQLYMLCFVLIRRFAFFISFGYFSAFFYCPMHSESSSHEKRKYFPPPNHPPSTLHTHTHTMRPLHFLPLKIILSRYSGPNHASLDCLFPPLVTQCTLQIYLIRKRIVTFICTANVLRKRLI